MSRDIVERMGTENRTSPFASIAKQREFVTAIREGEKWRRADIPVRSNVQMYCRF
jgi:hypothetical protein